ARKTFSHNKFKLEIIDTQIEGETAGVYTQGEFVDLCAGGHTASTKDVVFFKLTGISGSYWRADRDGQALQRITGVAFLTQQEMDTYFQRLQDAEKYDHRNLGKQLDLFSFHDYAPGMVFFHNYGTIVFNTLVNRIREELKKLDYHEIRTPHIMNACLWKQSGHYANYKQNMYLTVIEGEEHAVKPMNCPGAMLHYDSRPRSYRELPLRLAEFGHVHRHEMSGTLHGLFRVRSFVQEDAHIFCAPEQIKDEIISLIKLAQKAYSWFENFTNIKMVLATRPKDTPGNTENWNKATQALKEALESLGLTFEVEEGDGAFYGPKIDIKFTDAMDREWTISTIQVDFVLPENFDLHFIGADGQKHRPVAIHRAIIGSIERFMAVILEHTRGKLPFWLAPVQARVLSISEKQRAYAESVVKSLSAAGIRAEIDSSDEKISAKIKKAQMQYVPWMLVVGGQEETSQTVTLRTLDGAQTPGLTVDQLIHKANQ
ncbi:threonine--tRNA ligase, partial [Candidatus Dependentiae bacterium]|nr:threonine--tRNA ligase [Candidatus Dependentiae bacterium]